MTDSESPDSDSGSATGSDASAIGERAAPEDSRAAVVISEFYRVESRQMASGQNRIDQTTNWAVTVMAAFLTVVFSQPNLAAYILLIGILAMCGFLLFEVRRYRAYDASRSRVRLLEQNFFADVFAPRADPGTEWREHLAVDLRTPTLKMSFREALSRRLRRVYGPLMTVLGLAWLLRITMFTPQTRWIDAAAISSVPGEIVVVVVSLFYAGAAAVSYWPTRREARKDFHDTEVGKWEKP